MTERDPRDYEHFAPQQQVRIPRRFPTLITIIIIVVVISALVYLLLK